MITLQIGLMDMQVPSMKFHKVAVEMCGRDPQQVQQIEAATDVRITSP